MGTDARTRVLVAARLPASAVRAPETPAHGPYESDPFCSVEWQLACRVAASKCMAKSELLPRFLLHICELSLTGRASEITEQRIGMQIFNRPAGYNPGEDNIVRSYARTLRKRLEEHFAQEGRHEPLRINIPRGGYVPVFSVAPTDLVDTSEVQTDPAAPPPAFPLEFPSEQTYKPDARNSPSQRRSFLVALCGMVAGAVLVLGIWFAWTTAKAVEPRSVAHPLWSQLFQNNRETLIVPADSGLGILENLSKRSVTVQHYANGSYLNELMTPAMDPRNFEDIGQQRYTSVVDLDIVARLSRIPEYLPERTRIRYTRGVTADDFKTSNVILIGSKHTNPWVALFEHSMNFTLEYTNNVDESFLLNHVPVKGEQSTYRNAAGKAPGPTYGIIAYLPNLDGTGHVLILEGLNMAGTEAAAESLFVAKLIQPALKQATNAAGYVKSFELLVETSSVGAISPSSRILAIRVHDD